MAIFRRGKFYWFEFTFNGRRIRKSTKQGDRESAKKMCAKERTRLALGEAGLEPKPNAKNLTVGELLTALENDYKFRNKHSVCTQSHLARVRRDFGTIDAAGLTSERVDFYIERRMKAGDPAASINRVTQLLGQAYKLAIARKRLTAAPSVRHLSEKEMPEKAFLQSLNSARCKSSYRPISKTSRSSDI